MAKEKNRLPKVGNLRGNVFEKVKGKSKTVPGESFSIEEFVRKSSAGLIQENSVRSIFYEESEVDLSKLSAVDMTERDEMLEQISDRINILRGDIEELEKKALAERSGRKESDDTTKEGRANLEAVNDK